MTLHVPLWALIPGGLFLLGIALVSRKTSSWDYLSPTAALACWAGAALFMVGRCAA
jgi:hypothetical protein